MIFSELFPVHILQERPMKTPSPTAVTAEGKGSRWLCHLSGWVSLSELAGRIRVGGQPLYLPLSGHSGDREGLASSWVLKLSISAFLVSRSCWRLLISACGCQTVDCVTHLCTNRLCVCLKRAWLQALSQIEDNKRHHFKWQHMLWRFFPPVPISNMYGLF